MVHFRLDEPVCERVVLSLSVLSNYNILDALGKNIEANYQLNACYDRHLIHILLFRAREIQFIKIVFALELNRLKGRNAGRGVYAIYRVWIWITLK